MTRETTYEVAVHNEDVREKEKQGKRHHDISMEWSETHYIEITAGSAEEAHAKIAARYPAARGFVIEDVLPVRFEG